MVSIARVEHRERGRADGLLVRSVAVLGVLLAAFATIGAKVPESGFGGAIVGDGPGVSNDTVKVVFVGVDLQAVAKVTGFNFADAGSYEDQVQAIEEWVNARGGVGGRTLDAVFRLYAATDDSPAAEEQLCNQITQDDQAFAVVITGQFQTNARPCYAQRKTLVLDETLVATDAQGYEELAPYLWSPSYPEYGGFVRAQIATLSKEGFLDGRDRVGVVAADTPVNRRVIENLAVPLLEELDVSPEVAWVDTTDQGSLFQGNDQAAVTFRTKKIDRVVFLGGARLASIFTSVAASQSFRATYAVSSFDNPQFYVNNPDTIPPALLKGMVGVGFIASQDVPDDLLPFPSGPAETQCIEDVYGSAGITFASREAARVALPFCDAAVLLKGAGDLVEGDFNALTWGNAAHTLTDFQTATGFGGVLGPDTFAAAGSYRVMRYDAERGSFVYEGPDVDFPTR